MTDAPYGYIDDDPANGPRPNNYRNGAEFGMAARRIMLEAMNKVPLAPPTQEEIEAANIMAANFEGFIEGEKHERAKIVKWLRGSGDPVIANWLSMQIEAGEHLK